ncbi:pyrimidine reductase family protein [Aeromicrobium tamlense]|uniref:5-amino-6-(5-phosphoribosylamino)uracil reductase n=1 Tax=Aeromicrobium tamlense TaxID=375541 RepID=A0A8I0FTU0_9ACTN|nr:MULTISPECIES: pyrimidine reductase family protein [Aeromicrobium]MBD1270332.1 pyrimidine reductase family protein [Aeromicrobium tamlense]MBD1271536.1 pyrimidine reductase family protein [Aeromicrobium tamlense]NYI37718.1 5-amino-6-(5-phosphoribosylamino)uracil reductase [Aeromicrobium tamlense]
MPDLDELADLYAYPESHKPWLRTNFVASVDGGVQNSQGLSGTLGGEQDARLFQVLRSLADVVVVGAGTARAEGYRPIGADAIHETLREDRPRVPQLAVVSRHLDIPESLLTPGLMVITPAASDAERRQELSQSVEVIVAGEHEVDWPAVLDAFAARGLDRILCEGGPDLHGTLVDLDLVDEVCLTVSPHLLGGAAKRMTEGARPVELPMRLGHAIDDDGVLLTRWVRDRRAA